MGEMRIHTIFWSKILKGRDHTEDLGVDGRIICKVDLREIGCEGGTGFIWFRIGTSGELL
jgi:hypothetical protein